MMMKTKLNVPLRFRYSTKLTKCPVSWMISRTSMQILELTVTIQVATTMKCIVTSKIRPQEDITTIISMSKVKCLLRTIILMTILHTPTLQIVTRMWLMPSMITPFTIMVMCMLVMGIMVMGMLVMGMLVMGIMVTGMLVVMGMLVMSMSIQTGLTVEADTHMMEIPRLLNSKNIMMKGTIKKRKNLNQAETKIYGKVIDAKTQRNLHCIVDPVTIQTQIQDHMAT